MCTEYSQESSKGLYIGILYQIADNMTEDDLVKFELWACEDLSKATLETGKPLKWFMELQRRGKIAPEDLSYLEEFLNHAGLQELLSKVKKYETERHELMSESKKKKKKKTSKKSREHTDDTEEARMALDPVDDQSRFEGEKPRQDITFEADLLPYGVDSLFDKEWRPPSFEVKILARQVFRQPTTAASKNITERTLSVHKSSDSQCRDTEILLSSIHGLEQRINKEFRALKQVLGLVGTGVLLIVLIFWG